MKMIIIFIYSSYRNEQGVTDKYANRLPKGASL